jgi:UDP-N-acetyl-D-galactosamine dehydrogenase
MTPAGHDRIVVLGLGYVGLPLAVALARHSTVIGFDVDPERVAQLREGKDRTREIPAEVLAATSLEITSDPAACAGADVFIVTVPTPVDAEKRPDLTPVIRATETVAGLIDPERKPIIVYESTVYPGVTEDICGPRIEAVSGLSRGQDFFLGYSPERINPGDREHSIDRIVKVVAGENPQVTGRLAEIYGRITSAGVFRASSIKAAEAAKVIENAQRDINIAFMNEITQIFAKLDISIEAASTKWNFLKFQPGLVGGHCIGVDPYYLSYRAQELGQEPDVILAGRATNDGMGRWVADEVHARRGGPGSVLIMGLTFKENVPDLRNSRVIDLVWRLGELGHEITVHDPLASAEEARREYGVALDPDALTQSYDLVLVAVPHGEYGALGETDIRRLVKDGGLLADLKNVYKDRALAGIERWTL